MARIRDGRSQLGDASSIYLDLLRDLTRINSHLTSAAYPILDSAGQLRPSRLKKKRADKAADKAANKRTEDAAVEEQEPSSPTPSAAARS
jgi:phosphate:Na+ symporter